MALARLGGADVISASPERFLSRRGPKIETRYQLDRTEEGQWIYRMVADPG